MDLHGATHIGQTRKTNQDRYLIARLDPEVQVDQSSLSGVLDLKGRAPMPRGSLLVVADGVGGKPAGARASSVAIRSAVKGVCRNLTMLNQTSQAIDLMLQESLGRANATLKALGDEQPELEGMATTLTMALTTGTRLYVVHAGDSRCYLLRGGELHQLTRDHTLANALIDTGVEAARLTNPMVHNVLSSAIGGDTPLKVDVGHLDLEPDDIVLLCTDGLTRHVDAEMIKNSLSRAESAEQACRWLTTMANEAGGEDNITMVVARDLTLKALDA